MIWTHNICGFCWIEFHHGNGVPMPVCLKNPVEETCCFCGQKNIDGIFIRHDPRTLPNCKCKERA